MHEMSLLRDLLQKLDSLAAENHTDRIVSATVKIGALAHISGEHFREHWHHATTGHVAEHARLDVIESTDQNDPDAQEIILVSVEVPEL